MTTSDKPPPAGKHPREVIHILNAAFPACFAVYQQRRKPLKVGIKHDLVAVMAASGKSVVTEAEIGRALAIYSGDVGYIRKLKKGRPRFDLDGNVAGEVSADEAERAKLRLSCLVMDAVRRREQGDERPTREAKECVEKGDGLASLKAAWRARQGGAS
jgi:ProP effector